MMTSAAYQDKNVLLAPIEIVRGASSDAADWDAYVERHPDGTFFQLFGWGAVVAETYGYEPVYLIAKRAGVIAGVLLLVDVKAPLMGRSLISTAFTVGGGPLGDDPLVIGALVDAAAHIGEERRVQYIELRGPSERIDGWRQKTGKHAVFRAALPSNDEENLAMIPRKRRAEIRKALKAEADGRLSLRVDRDADGFYALYARSLRDLGTPVFSRKFLRAIQKTFSEKTEISFADVNGAPVASLLSFYFKDSVLPYYVGAAPGVREERAHEFLYWSLMRRAVDRGYTMFDFGRSKVDSGPYHFKKLWGFEPAPLTYHYKMIAAKDLPDINPNNPKFERLTKIWRRLPLPLANRLGPFAAANFP